MLCNHVEAFQLPSPEYGMKKPSLLRVWVCDPPVLPGFWFCISNEAELTKRESGLKGKTKKVPLFSLCQDSSIFQQLGFPLLSDVFLFFFFQSWAESPPLSLTYRDSKLLYSQHMQIVSFLCLPLTELLYLLGNSCRICHLHLCTTLKIWKGELIH